MAEVTMPRLSDTMEEGTIASWLKKPGEQVTRGEVIAQIETDKATMDLTAFEAGTLQEILAPEGTTVAIGQPVARIGQGAGSAKAKPPADATAEAPPDASAPKAKAPAEAPPGDGAASSEPPANQPKAAAATGDDQASAEGASPAAAGADKAAPARAGGDKAAPAAAADATADDQVEAAEAASPAAAGRDRAATAAAGGDKAAPAAADAMGDDQASAEGASPAAAGGDKAAPAAAADSTGDDQAEAAKGAMPAAAADSTGGDKAATDATGAGGVDKAGAAATHAARGDRAEAAAAPSDGKTRASPMARHLAAEHGLDLGRISGSGPQGRVIRADVEAAIGATSAKGSGRSADAAAQDDANAQRATDGAQRAADSGPDADAPRATGGAQRAADSRQGADAQQAASGALQPKSGGPSADDDERVTLSQMRRTIARRMAESTRTVPHFFLTTTVDASEMVKLRKQILDQTADTGTKISFNDMVLKGAALALRKVPEVNVSFAEDSLIRHKRVHIGVAVATERGLIVPVVRDVDQKGLGQISRETRDLAERANAGKLQPPDYSGGTFTVSNLGMFGVEQFNAVINPPESAILAVGAITREPAEHDGQIELRERMKLTLSVDHRALDGAIGARYLQALKQLLEKPMLLLV